MIIIDDIYLNFLVQPITLQPHVFDTFIDRGFVVVVCSASVATLIDMCTLANKSKTKVCRVATQWGPYCWVISQSSLILWPFEPTIEHQRLSTNMSQGDLYFHYIKMGSECFDNIPFLPNNQCDVATTTGPFFNSLLRIIAKKHQNFTWLALCEGNPRCHEVCMRFSLRSGSLHTSLW